VWKFRFTVFNNKTKTVQMNTAKRAVEFGHCLSFLHGSQNGFANEGTMSQFFFAPFDLTCKTIWCTWLCTLNACIFHSSQMHQFKLDNPWFIQSGGIHPLMDFFQSGSSNPFANQLKNWQELEQERCMILISDWNDWKRMMQHPNLPTIGYA